MKDRSDMSRVLIAGGSGLIGRHLSRRLLEQGYEVAILSRNRSNLNHITSYSWDLNQNEIQREALNDCDYIINLAGENIGAKRWTRKRKQEILESRIKSSKLIFDNIEKENHKLRTFITASAIGYYGAETSDHIYHESDRFARDFLGQTCSKWEQAADQFAQVGVRTVKIRTGIVLSKVGGALAKLNIPIRLGFASPIGHGKQYMPWIHIEDLCNIYIYAIQNQEMTGAYNAVAPEHITNKEFIRKAAQKLDKPFWFPNIPASALKLRFGELAALLLTGSRVSSEKLLAAGYSFQFPDIDSAFENLYVNK